LISLIKPFPTVGGTPHGSSWLRIYSLLKISLIQVDPIALNIKINIKDIVVEFGPNGLNIKNVFKIEKYKSALLQ
jgi:hypothetical protein